MPPRKRGSPHKGKKYQLWTQATMRDALQDYDKRLQDAGGDVNKVSVRRVAVLHGVPQTTLQNRINNRVSGYGHMSGKKSE